MLYLLESCTVSVSSVPQLWRVCSCCELTLLGIAFGTWQQWGRAWPCPAPDSASQSCCWNWAGQQQIPLYFGSLGKGRDQTQMEGTDSSPWARPCLLCSLWGPGNTHFLLTSSVTKDFSSSPFFSWHYPLLVPFTVVLVCLPVSSWGILRFNFPQIYY